MLNAVRGCNGATEPSRWYPGERTKEYAIIRVSVIREQERRFSTLLQNLVTMAESTLLRTGNVHDYQPRQQIFYRDRWWEIVSVAEDTQSVNPQTVRLVKPNLLTPRLLEIIGVD